MSYRYLVIGTGVGKAIAWWLLHQKDTTEVQIADVSVEGLLETQRLLKTKESHFSTWLMDADEITSGASLTEQHAFPSFNVVVSAVPARYNPFIARCAIESGAHFCDLGGVVPITKHMLGDDAKARSADVSVITDNGLMPGLGNIMAVELVDFFPEGNVESVTISSGAIPLLPQARHANYQRVYSGEGLEHIVFGTVPELRNGEITNVDPLKTFNIINTPDALEEFTDFTWMEAFASSGAALAPWYLQTMGVRNFVEYTLRWPGFENFVRNTPRDQFCKTFSGLPPTDTEHPDMVYMEVRVQTAAGESRSFELVDVFDQATGLASIERTTGFPAAAMACMQARGHIPPGVRTADRAFDTNIARSDYLFEMEQLFDIARHSREK